MYFSARSHPFAKVGITIPHTPVSTSLIAFPELNLLARFNHPKYVHIKIKLINKLGIFLYFPHSCTFHAWGINYLQTANKILGKNTTIYMSICLSGMIAPIY